MIKDIVKKSKKNIGKALRSAKSSNPSDKGHKALALVKEKNKAELAHSASFDKRHGTFEERLKKYGSEMKK